MGVKESSQMSFEIETEDEGIRRILEDADEMSPVDKFVNLLETSVRLCKKINDMDRIAS